MVAAVTAVVALAEWVRRRRERRWADGARQVEIMVPPQVQPDSAQMFWEHMHGALARTRWQRLGGGQHLLGFEYHIAPDEGAIIRLWVPGGVPPHLIENAVTVAWRGARTHTQPATPPLPLTPAGHRSVLSGGELRLGRAARWPIRTNAPGDPAAALINAASAMEPRTTACVQVLARPTTTRPARHTGNTGVSTGFAGFLLELAREFLGLFTRGPARPVGGPVGRTSVRGGYRDRQVSLEQSAQDRAAADKALATQWATVVRYAVTASVPVDADRSTRSQVAARVRGRAHAVSSFLSGASGHNHYHRRRSLRLRQTLSWRRLRRGDRLSCPELAVIAHLPLDAGIAEIHRAGARALAPSEVIASGGSGTKPLGRADAVTGKQVAMRVSDARHHVHVLGPTGTGKSTLLGRMILADADAGRGLVLIDPKGDLVTDVLTRLPEDAGDRVVLFDADSASPPPCINPLDLTTFGGDLDLVVDNIGTVFARIYHQFWGPRTDDVFRNSLYTVCTQPRPATLADIERILADDTYRARLVASVKKPEVQRFWRAFDALGESGRVQLTAPLLNKLRQLLLRPFVKTALAGGPATVDLTAALDHGGLVLARLPKGRLGEDTTRLLGALLVARTWQVATARAATPATERRDAALYLDEFHNFLHSSTPVEDMLAEARALKLSMVLAHQNLGQLTPTLREAISTNARNKIYFAVSPEDSRDLARHTLPQLSDHDLAHLDAYHAAARLVVNGQNTAPCTVATEPLPPPIPGRARRVRAAARTTPVPRPAPAASPTPRLKAPAPRVSRRDPRRR
ncbi:type IV secretory system conjugative DNA transfer family protein [Nocardia nova]|uniref:Type IV secretory system conjugative DNA transfer family protein n=1 Tax=Nocardia nova TaxID=37330 RepID=A0A2S5ZV53_9NOCA|nr:type IV secretory system conjugative DNA transfer family protein [Nocardia nova]PPJ05530.1 type IV secretory system conjugative DNA transfer family protein [Nocardia nova]PPJ19366.1 type IV secretory system conjugative DNA transfer family protein [Nocardia nova]